MSYRDPIFKAATRPAMFFGVPMIPFLAFTGLFMLLAMWLFYLVSFYVSLLLGLLYVPIVMVMRQITKRDDQRLHQLWKRAVMRTRHAAGRRMWGAISFSPIRFKSRAK
jgi:type IV secretion system protein VirB3